VVSFLGRRRLVSYESVSISGRGWVMRLLLWGKLEPFVTVVNRNGRCKPKFVLGFVL